LSSPLITLLAIAAGLGVAVVLVVALLSDAVPRRRAWALAATIVAFVAVAASWLPAFRDRAYGLDQQRKAAAGTVERVARERCALDQGRTDLPAAFQFARQQIPEDARFLVRPAGRILPCLMLNVIPRVPASPDDFDAGRDWVIWDQPPPPVARRARRELALPEAERRYLTNGSMFVIVRPEEAAP